MKKKSTFKDINLLIATKANPELISLGRNKRDKIVDTIRADMTFLRRNNIIDYSLLLGIETDKGNTQSIHKSDNAMKVSKDIESSTEAMTDLLSIAHGAKRDRCLTTRPENNKRVDEATINKMRDLHVFEHNGMVYHMAIIDFL